MKIAFTGHRNIYISNMLLENLFTEFPEAYWCHGGAKGFDTQVSLFCKKNNIKEEIIKPDYQKYNSKSAPTIRNFDIVNGADLLVACYDGRKAGGTYDAIKKARNLNIKIRIWKPTDV